MQDYNFAIKSYPTVLGSDSCGIVTAVGPSVTKFQVGDRVFGFASVIYTSDPNSGAFQTYTILRDIATTKIPDSMSFAEGSVFPMAMATSAIALFACLGVPRPEGSVAPKKDAFLVWGASSSVGTAAVQLAKESGFKVFATASPAHHEYLKTIGVSEVFDYHDALIVDNIIAAAKSTGTPLKFGFDTVGEGNSAKKSADILLKSGGKGGKLCLVLPWPDKGNEPEGIELSETAAYRHGADQAELGQWFFNEYLEKTLMDGSIVSAPKVELVPGGIDGLQKALDRSKAGVSGRKLVVEVE